MNNNGTAVSKPFFTIDTDNAVIRLYSARARAAGIPEDAIAQTLTDLRTMALGITNITGCVFILAVEARD